MTETVTARKGINSSSLKLIAMFSMLIDHAAAVLVWNPSNPGAQTIVQDMSMGNGTEWLVYLLMRYPIGRLAFPIYCFLLVEGFMRTRSVKKYALRMLLFAMVSEIPFDLAIYGSLCNFQGQNVFFTLFLGLVALEGADLARQKMQKEWLIRVSSFIVVAMVCVIAELISCDYGANGILAIFMLYLFRYDRKNQMLAGSVVFLWEITAPLAFIPIYFYNGKRGANLKYFFYGFYPVHLLILYGILQLMQY